MCVNQYHGVMYNIANGENLSVVKHMAIPCEAYRNIGTCNDYEFVTQYGFYWYEVGSAH